MVIGLGVCPSVCSGQILKSSDEIRSGNGVLALGTKKFRNLVLLHPEVETGGPVGSCGSWCSVNVSPSSKSSFSVAMSMLSVPVLVAAILAVCKLYFSYKRCFDFLIFRSSVLIWLASLSFLLRVVSCE